MDFNEKLQELRKNRGMTQEELAEALYVSRTAISKWESGRGYPNIDSLKDISNFFSVSIDELLSGEKLLSIAEKENNANIRKLFQLTYGIVDLFSFILIILPLYPNAIDGFVYSVNLLNYTQISQVNKIVYWVMFILLFVIGIVQLTLTKATENKSNKSIMYASIVINIVIVLFLALTREAYAVVVAFLLLIIKGVVFINCFKRI